MSTKACHLEVVTSLHEEACLAAIARFCCDRRDRPTKIFSDNANNFHASRADLDTRFEIDAFHRHMKQTLSIKAIEWLVLPVHVPYLGGPMKQQSSP